MAAADLAKVVDAPATPYKNAFFCAANPFLSVVLQIFAKAYCARPSPQHRCLRSTEKSSKVRARAPAVLGFRHLDIRLVIFWMIEFGGIDFWCGGAYALWR